MMTITSRSKNDVNMMKNDVASNASKIWCLLSERGVLSVRKIGEMINSQESLLFLALGWLVKENKIRFLDKSGILHVEPIITIHETYY